MTDPDPDPRLPVPYRPTQSEPPTKPYRVRHDGWTGARKRRFLHALARTGCVRDACRIAHISSTSAYRHYKRDPEFGQAWERALTEILPVLEAAAFERAVEGVWEPVVSGGAVAVYRKRYSDAILVTLLKRADMAEARHGAEPVDEDVVLARLDAKLAEMHRRQCENPDCTECNG